ncbi:MAG: PadR family transcriptional regulator [Clostridiales Family XIII bacterium]|jgi:DNA-binding PadR family transcriptional regulator|nr:PadR family transcriptional regulator [Clostridiales Family XIII bacterium]
MSLKYGILGFLQYGAQSGWALDKAFKASVDHFWHATLSQIYRELNSMEQNGMVASETVIQNDKPNKKEYSVTPKGSEAFMAWLGSPPDGDIFHLRSSFLMRVFFSGGRPASDTLKMLAGYQAACEAALADLTPQWEKSAEEYAEEVPDPETAAYWRLTGDFGGRYLKMCAEWAEAAQKTVREQEGHL